MCSSDANWGRVLRKLDVVNNAIESGTTDPGSRRLLGEAGSRLLLRTRSDSGGALATRTAHSQLARLGLVLVAIFGLLSVTTPAGALLDSAIVVPSPSPGTNGNNLDSVSCVSES